MIQVRMIIISIKVLYVVCLYISYIAHTKILLLSNLTRLSLTLMVSCFMGFNLCLIYVHHAGMNANTFANSGRGNY